MSDNKITMNELFNFDQQKRGEDIIGELFTSQEIESIHMYENYKNLHLQPILLNEKCSFVINDISIDISNVNPLSMAESFLIKNGSYFDDFYRNCLDPQIVKSVREKGLALPIDIFELYENLDYYDTFCIAAQLTTKECQLLDETKTDYRNGNNCRSIPNFIMNDNIKYRLFLKYGIASFLKRKMDEDKHEQTRRNHIKDMEMEFDFIRKMRLSKMFVESVIEKYDEWERYADIQKQMLYCKIQEECLENDDSENVFEWKKTNILRMFLNYYSVYSDQWKKVCFEEGLEKNCHTFHDKKYFEKELKKHKYGTEFCEEYERYIKENPGVKPLFDTKLVLDPIPILIKDDDKEHEKWFESIHISKVKDKTNECLYKAVSKLYETLKDKELIVNAPKDLFVYRFTGFLPSWSIDERIEWQGEAKNYLAFILNCLYRRKEGTDVIIKTKYTKISNYFYPQIGNGSALAESLDNNKKKKVIQMLEDCGFLNTDPNKL